MITFGNWRAGLPHALVLGERDSIQLLSVVIEVARALAGSRWERELVAWLNDRRWAISAQLCTGVDLGDVAVTPAHFAEQRDFLVTTCRGAMVRLDLPATARLARAVDRLTDLALALPPAPVARRWHWVGPRPAVRT